MTSVLTSAPARVGSAQKFLAKITLAAMLATTALSGSALAAGGGGLLVVAQSADAQPVNILALRAGNAPWVRNVFETLTRINPETFDAEPLLAKSWTLADDGLSMDIVLRDDVTFHTGRKMTAEDVKFSFETAALPETASQVGFIARQFDGIDVTGDTTLTIRFKNPLSNIFDFFEETYIVDQETYAEREDGSKVIGTGAYTFDEWVPGGSVRLSRYEGYRDDTVGNFDEMEFAIITDPTASVAALRSDRAQVAGLTPRDAVEFVRNPQFELISAGGAIYPLGLNVTMPPFDNKLVRQAVGYAVDRERINAQVFSGTGTVTDLFWSPSAPGVTEEAMTHYTYDPDKARAMIEEAGAVGAKVPIVVPAIPANQSIFEIVQNNLREVGLDPEAVVLDVADFDKRQVAGDLGPAFLLIHGQIGFSSTTLLSSLPSLREGNPSGMWTDEYVALRQDMSSARNRDDLAAATGALTDYMLDEAFTLALVQSPGLNVVSARLEGVELSVRGGLIFDHAYLE